MVLAYAYLHNGVFSTSASFPTVNPSLSSPNSLGESQNRRRSKACTVSVSAGDLVTGASILEVARHVLRTMVMVFVGAAFFIGITVAMIFLEVNAYVVMVTPMVLLLAFVYFSARWHPYWAPISKHVMRIPWSQDDGTAMETCIEIAIFAAGNSNTSVYRASIYESLTGKRIKRCLIGDSVTLLGHFDPGVWFYIHDRFYPRLDGLVCLDIRTCEWRFHQPQSVIELDESATNRQGVLNVIRNGIATQIDLQRIPD